MVQGARIWTDAWTKASDYPVVSKMDSIVRPSRRFRNRTLTPGTGAVSLKWALEAIISQWIWDLSWLSFSSWGHVRELMFRTKLTQPLPLTERQKNWYIIHKREEESFEFCSPAIFRTWMERKGLWKKKKRQGRGKQKRDKMSFLFSLINLGRWWQCRMRNGK